VKTKKFAIPLTVVEPWVPAALAAGYLVGERFKPERYATTVGHDPLDLERRALWMQWRNDRRQRQGNSLTGAATRRLSERLASFPEAFSNRQRSVEDRAQRYDAREPMIAECLKTDRCYASAL
jgi:hypothetical protein